MPDCAPADDVSVCRPRIVRGQPVDSECEEGREMEIVSAINARLAEYQYDIFQISKANPIRLTRGERESGVGRGLARMGK